MVEKKLVVPCQKAAEVVEKEEVTKPASLLKEERPSVLRLVTPVPPEVVGSAVPREREPMTAVAAESLLVDAVVE